MALLNINIDNFNGGLVPSYWTSDYPRWGNKNMCAKAQAIDLRDPSHLKQGIGRTSLSTIASDIILLDQPVSENLTYGVQRGGRNIYEITPTSVTHTATLEANAEANSIAYYQGDVWFGYDHTADGRIASLSAPTTAITGLTRGVPHRMVAGGLNILAICNGNQFAKFDGTTLVPDSLILPEDHILIDLQFTREFVMGVTNYPAVTPGARSSIFLWDTESTSWTEYPFRERITNLFVSNGITFVHYDDLGRSRLGALDGASIKPLASYDGDSPYWYQVASRKGFVAWSDGANILCWGAPEPWMEPVMFPLMRAASGHSYNSIAAPFGYLITNSDDGTNYLTEKEDNYAASGFWKSILFQVAGENKDGVLNEIIARFNQLPTGKGFTIRLVNSQGTTIYEQAVSGNSRTKFEDKFSLVTDDVRIEIHFDAVTANTVEISSIMLKGNTRT